MELVGSEVCHDKRDDVTDDSGEITPEKALVENEIDHSTDESEMPVVPQVDIDRARGLRDDHEEIDAEADRDDESAYGGVVSDRGSSGPAHVEDTEVEREDVLNGLQRVFEVIGQKGCDDTEADEADADIKARLQSLAKLHADAEADDGEDDRHHHRCTKLNDVVEDVHICVLLFNCMLYV